MNTVVWIVVGAVIGFVACKLLVSDSLNATAENILVAVFGAFVGGEFVAAQFNGGVSLDSETFRFSSLLIAIGCSVALLALLTLLRRALVPPKRKRPSSERL